MSDAELSTVVALQSVTAASVSPLQDIESEPTNRGQTEQGLAPVDGGPAAWKLLLVAFMFETLLWGKFLF